MRWGAMTICLLGIVHGCKAAEGEDCVKPSDCAEGLTCLKSRCVTAAAAASARAAEEALAAEANKLVRAKKEVKLERGLPGGGLGVGDAAPPDECQAARLPPKKMVCVSQLAGPPDRELCKVLAESQRCRPLKKNTFCCP
jgi:hypothetical protein